MALGRMAVGLDLGQLLLVEVPLDQLVTARNRLTEEGTKGFTSAGAQRSNPAPCP